MDRHCSSCQLRQLEYRVLTELSSQQYSLPMSGWQIRSANEHLVQFPTSRSQGFQCHAAGQGFGFQDFQGGHGIGFQDFQGWQGLGNSGYPQDRGGRGGGRKGGRGGRGGRVIIDSGAQVRNKCIRRQKIEQYGQPEIRTEKRFIPKKLIIQSLQS